MATIDLGAKDYQAALEELSIVAQAAPNDPTVHLNMAFAYGGLKKFPEAEREFQTALKLNPQYDTAASEYVAMLFALNQGPKALQVASQYATANPNRANGAIYLCFRPGQQPRSSTKPFRSIRRPSSWIRRRLLSYMQLARVYELQGKIDDALATYQKALAVSPNNPTCHGRDRQCVPGQERPQVGAAVLRKGQHAGSP